MAGSTTGASSWLAEYLDSDHVSSVREIEEMEPILSDGDDGHFSASTCEIEEIESHSSDSRYFSTYEGEETDVYVPYNILPLNDVDRDHPLRRFPTIEPIILALKDTTGLEWPTPHGGDILDWLQAMFGFQTDNVANQREHLILLLNSLRIELCRSNEHAIKKLKKKIFKNYKRWCKHLDLESSLRLPNIQQKMQHRLLYVGLYLLIWGEAANLRFMPECLCYIYHHMALELYGMLAGHVCPRTGEKVKPAYGGDEEAFLSHVVAPIYDVIAKEVKRSRNGNAKYSEWRNYDDLNEYFWSVDCLRLGWPMRLDADFFYVPESNLPGVRKVGFVEIRTIFQLIRSFDRMWSFLLLALQAMLIIAWNDSRNAIRKTLSIFITASVLNLGQAVLDIVLSWKSRHTMALTEKKRYNLKVVSAAIWVITFLAIYPMIWLCLLAGAIYLSPCVFSFLVFHFPRLLERSSCRIFAFLMWWTQPRLYVGRGMRESGLSVFRYALFWIVILTVKLVFSYYIEIKPLVGPTKDIMSLRVPQHHDLLPQVLKNVGAVIILWVPIILVYFLDTQIWYATVSSVFGGIHGVMYNLGEIRTLDMLRYWFRALPIAFSASLFPSVEAQAKKIKKEMRVDYPSNLRVPSTREATRFAQLWNQIIETFRVEDVISNREMDLMLIPYWPDLGLSYLQLPLFTLGNKIVVALDMAKRSCGDDDELAKELKADKSDNYMYYAVHECYASFRSIIIFMVQGENEKSNIENIFTEVEGYVEAGNLITIYKMLPSLHDHLVKLIEYLLENKREDRDQVIHHFQDMLEIVIREMREDTRSLEGMSSQSIGAEAIKFPIEPVSKAWKEKIRRLYLMLTMTESGMNVPSNVDAQRRLLFFSNSVFMNMPLAPQVKKMLSFSVLTPYYKEDVAFSLQDLETQNEDGISVLFYLQKIYPDEWENFLERIGCKNEEELRHRDDMEENLRLWASYRGQTLTRTVRGMMYYRKALELQVFLDMVRDDVLVEGGYKAFEVSNEEYSRHVVSRCQAFADLKFTYVVACQHYGIQKRAGDQRAQDILNLMTTYPSLRVAYVDEVEVQSKDRSRQMHKVYYSALVKAALPKASNSTDSGENLDQVIYKIKLPGQPILGEGKPENQNHAIIFTRGVALQTIDMNQDNYLEEALKMRNLLQEFRKREDGLRRPTILGVREHIFTGSVSSLGGFMSNQETTFVTMGQRLLAFPLKVRFHYGHPDVFDRLFHLTIGGVSKASKVINLSEDIFAGINSTLRDGNVSYHEYIQVGKGRDVGLNQISMFEAKIASGNAEQTLSRDMHRLGQHFDFFRTLSCYYTTVGLYINSWITVLTIFAFLYGRVILVFIDFPQSVSYKPIQAALHSVSLIQLGFLLIVPMIVEIWLEKGLIAAVVVFFRMHLQLGPAFFTFMLGTKAHYFGRTLLHGGAKYRATGRGFVVFHAKFAENCRLYSRSHFVKGMELLLLLLTYGVCGHPHNSTHTYFITTGAIWFMVCSWLFSPLIFNPSGFEWHNIVADWDDWYAWMKNPSGIGVPPEKSWESWWEDEHEHLRRVGVLGMTSEILLSFRFFAYQAGIIYHLYRKELPSFIVSYIFSWEIALVMPFAIKGYLSKSRRCVVFKRLITSAYVGIIIYCLVSFKFIPMVLSVAFCTWGTLSVVLTQQPLLHRCGIWRPVKKIVWFYDFMIGFFLLLCISVLGSLPVVSDLQTRMLFNQAFGRGLQISRILSGGR